MKRFFCQRIFCSPLKTEFNSVIEFDEEGIITRLISFDSLQHETSSTINLNGVIAPEIISLQEHLTKQEIEALSGEFSYIFLNDRGTRLNIDYGKTLVLDFGTTDINKINEKLQSYNESLKNIPLKEIIAAFTFNPAKVLEKNIEIKPGNKVRCSLWPAPESYENHLIDKISVRYI